MKFIKSFFWSSLKNELNYLDYTCKKIEDDKFKERVKYYLKWYIIKSKHAKFWFYFFNTLNIILPLILTYINSCYKDNYDCIKILIPLVISFVNGILILGRFLDKWNNYRTTITMINLFLNNYIDEQEQVDFSSKKNDEHRKFDIIIKNEGINWKSIQDKYNQEDS